MFGCSGFCVLAVLLGPKCPHSIYCGFHGNSRCFAVPQLGSCSDAVIAYGSGILIGTLMCAVAVVTVHKWGEPGTAAGQRHVFIMDGEDGPITGYCSGTTVPAQQGHLPQRPHL